MGSEPRIDMDVTGGVHCETVGDYVPEEVAFPNDLKEDCHSSIIIIIKMEIVSMPLNQTHTDNDNNNNNNNVSAGGVPRY